MAGINIESDVRQDENRSTVPLQGYSCVARPFPASIFALSERQEGVWEISQVTMFDFPQDLWGSDKR